MKILDRNGSQRFSSKADSDYNTCISRPSITPRRQSTPITSIAALHNKKRETCPVMSFDHNAWGLQSVNKVAVPSILQNRSKRTDEMMMKDRENEKLGWKILTLTQIKGIKSRIAAEQRDGDNLQRNSRKLFVSISKRNKQSMSKQKATVGVPKLQDSKGQYKLLRSISNKKKIVESVELQLQESIKINQFFCV